MYATILLKTHPRQIQGKRLKVKKYVACVVYMSPKYFKRLHGVDWVHYVAIQAWVGERTKSGNQSAYTSCCWYTLEQMSS